MKHYLLFPLVFTCSLFADLSSEGKINEQTEAEEAPLIGRIRIVANQAAIQTACKTTDLIQVEITSVGTQIVSALEPYINQEITPSILKQLKETVQNELAADPMFLFSVSIPQQTVDYKKDEPNTITVLAEPSTIGQVEVVENRWFRKRWICNKMGLNEGDKVRRADLLNSAAWINYNPFIHTEVVLRPGKSTGTTDIDLVVHDRFPARVYAGTDNTGNSFSNNNRMFTGVNASLGLNVLFAYQFTSSYDFPVFLSHYGNLTFFLPWKHQLVFYGGYARMHPTITDFESKGSDTQLSMRYLVLLKPLYTSFQNQIDWGVDFKQTNSALFFLGALPGSSRIPVSQQQASLFQFYLGYKLSKRKQEKINYSCEIDLFFSLFRFLPHQTTADYNALRPEANIRYFYGKAAFCLEAYTTKRYKYVAFLRGQAASGALLPSEQYGLGGYDTVRGYQERVYLADNAAICNLEFYFPKKSVFWLTQGKEDGISFLLFADGAYGYNWHATTSYPKDAWLMGVGPGLRYVYGPYLMARFDYGFRIHNTSFGNGQFGRFHFSVTAGY